MADDHLRSPVPTAGRAVRPPRPGSARRSAGSDPAGWDQAGWDQAGWDQAGAPRSRRYGGRCGRVRRRSSVRCGPWMDHGRKRVRAVVATGTRAADCSAGAGNRDSPGCPYSTAGSNRRMPAERREAVVRTPGVGRRHGASGGAGRGEHPGTVRAPQVRPAADEQTGDHSVPRRIRAAGRRRGEHPAVGPPATTDPVAER